MLIWAWVSEARPCFLLSVMFMSLSATAQAAHLVRAIKHDDGTHVIDWQMLWWGRSQVVLCVNNSKAEVCVWQRDQVNTSCPCEANLEWYKAKNTPHCSKLPPSTVSAGSTLYQNPPILYCWFIYLFYDGNEYGNKTVAWYIKMSYDRYCCQYYTF